MRTNQLVLGFTIVTAATAVHGEPKPGTSASMQGNVFRPAKLEPTPERLKTLKVADGFSIEVFADGLEKPRMLAVHPDGTVYVTRRDPGDVWMLRDVDGDGRAEIKVRVAAKKDLHGIALAGDKVYLASSEEVFEAARKKDGTLRPLTSIARGFPAGGQHNNRTIGVGPDGKLYVSVGSTCNACDETTPESATLVQLDRGGKNRKVFATGLRNTIGFAWHPKTKQLWGMDHGIDWLGDEDQREELNLIEDGQKYGWPYIYADGKANPASAPKNNVPHEQWAKESRAPVLLHTAHSAPMQLAFTAGTQFPASHQGGAFLALHGSWNRKTPAGYEVVFVRFDERGQPTKIEPFVSGFVTRDGQFGRPCGVAFASDGSLLVSDDDHGVVYRIRYTKK